MPTLSPSNCINVEHQGVEGGKFLRRRERLTRSGLVMLSVSTERSGDVGGFGRWRGDPTRLTRLTRLTLLTRILCSWRVALIDRIGSSDGSSFWDLASERFWRYAVAIFDGSDHIAFSWTTLKFTMTSSIASTALEERFLAEPGFQ